MTIGGGVDPLDSTFQAPFSFIKYNSSESRHFTRKTRPEPFSWRDILLVFAGKFFWGGKNFPMIPFSLEVTILPS